MKRRSGERDRLLAKVVVNGVESRLAWRGESGGLL